MRRNSSNARCSLGAAHDVVALGVALGAVAPVGMDLGTGTASTM
jgi:hypothetical protein